MEVGGGGLGLGIVARSDSRSPQRSLHSLRPWPQAAASAAALALASVVAASSSFSFSRSRSRSPRAWLTTSCTGGRTRAPCPGAA